MSQSSIFNVRLTAFHTINTASTSQDSELPAFKSETVSQARAARDCAPIRADSPAVPIPTAGSAVQLTRAGDAADRSNVGNASPPSSPGVVLRHAPLRPARGHIVDMPMAMHWGSNGSLNSRA
ncbi:MAG TPA: hypothetical protein VL522_17245, partial [Bordetella sp.]|nr:hypothetical protein [Bordetella sp.]